MACSLLPVAGTTSISSTEFTIYLLAHLLDVFFFSNSRVTTPKADREAVQVKIPRLRGAQVRGRAKLESRSFKGFRLKTPRMSPSEGQGRKAC